ncbi:hypothetical protein ACP3VW_16115 [Vibrio sp. DNB22_17_1]|nr:hypothetical protein ACOMICROBIO_GDFFDHBD_02151 [Vibrio sp. B1REV9]
MGTVIGLLILAGVDVYLKRKTGLHVHQWIAKKYSDYQKNKGE